MSGHVVRAGVLALVTAVTALVLVPGTALAHVGVDKSSSPGKGGYGVVRLNVPTESSTASTVGLTVAIPDDVVLKSARVLPVAGWTGTVEKTGDRVTQIVWAADDPAAGGLGPAEFGQFTFSGGPWPEDRDSVPLPATQRYSDGSVVAWDEVAVDAASEPEHPAPVVVLGAAEADQHGAGVTPVENAAHGTPEVGGGGAAEAVRWALTGLAVLLAAGALGLSLRSRRGGE